MTLNSARGEEVHEGRFRNLRENVNCSRLALSRRSGFWIRRLSRMFVSVPGERTLHLLRVLINRAVRPLPLTLSIRGVRNEVGAMIPSAKEVEHARELLS